MRYVGGVMVFLGLLVGTAAADEPTAPAEAPAAPEDDLPPHQAGPALIDLGDGVEIDLPAGILLLERAEARAMLEAAGEDPEGVLAVIWPPEEDANGDVRWSLLIVNSDIGHVSDADADQLDAGELLTSFRRGTEAQNPKRVAAGSTELYVDSWSKTPSYSAATRVLSWAMNLHDRDGQILNDFTNLLGRRGYVSINLVASPADIEQARVEAAATIRGVRWKPGHRYEDFDPAVDKDSGIGLRELVVGGGIIAAVKAGKVGLIAKILLAFKKFFIVIGLAFAGFFKWLHAKLTGRRAADAGGGT